MNKPELILLVGPPASGKTSWAQNYIEQHPNTVIVGRDKLREMMFGYTEATVHQHYTHADHGKRERDVIQLQQSIVRNSLNEGKSVIIDDTNLDKKTLKKWLSDYQRYPIRLEVMQATREECLARNASRTRIVADETMKAHYDRYLNFCSKSIPTYYPATIPQHYQPDPLLPPAYIVDLDGTIANLDHRQPYGCTDEEILADKPILPVVEIVLQLSHQGNLIVFLSGREDKHLEATSTWLYQQVGNQNWSLYMRKTNDSRKDSIIKQEIFWTEVASRFQIKGVFDDRKQVKQMWVDMGLFVFDVNQHDLWF